MNRWMEKGHRFTLLFRNLRLCLDILVVLRCLTTESIAQVNFSTPLFLTQARTTGMSVGEVEPPLYLTSSAPLNETTPRSIASSIVFTNDMDYSFTGDHGFIKVIVRRRRLQGSDTSEDTIVISTTSVHELCVPKKLTDMALNAKH